MSRLKSRLLNPHAVKTTQRGVFSAGCVQDWSFTARSALLCKGGVPLFFSSRHTAQWVAERWVELQDSKAVVDEIASLNITINPKTMLPGELPAEPE